MNRIKFSFVVTILAGLLFLAACGGAAEPDADEVSTAVALTVAALNAAATPVSELPPTPIIATPVATIAEAEPPTAVPPTAPPTAELPPPATEVVRLPPNLDNVAVGGENFPAGHVFGGVIVDPAFLIRMAVRDSNFFAAEGDRDGAGIDYVEFFVADADGFPVYDHRENVAGYCIFAGGEPDCNLWPANDDGQYTWGAGGPVVESGDYQFNINVISKAPDDDFEFGGFWNWNFTITVTVP